VVPRLWPYSVILCVGSGPSLLTADIQTAYVAGAKILAVNSAYQVCPHLPDVIFAADEKWWGWHPGVVAAPCLKYSVRPTKIDGVTSLEWTLGEGIDTRRDRVMMGGHSGYAAINLAAHLGACRILLTGYDMAPGRHGEHHAHDPHPDGSHPNYKARIGVYASCVEPLRAQGIEIVNCSRKTAIKGIPVGDLEQELCLRYR